MIAVSGLAPLAEELFETLNDVCFIKVKLITQLENNSSSGWIFISNSGNQSGTFKMYSISGKMYDMVNASIKSLKAFNLKTIQSSVIGRGLVPGSSLDTKICESYENT